MKNTVIVVLVLLVGALGFLYFTKDENSTSSRNKNKNSNNTSDSSNTSSPQSQNTTTVSGKTIDLSEKGLTELNKDILNDSSVVVLDVSDNNLTGALPAEIRKLTNLETINASNNNLTGIPAEIGQLSKLKFANFSGNNISGLPLEIGNLSNLDTLDLRGNPNVSKYDIDKIQSKIPNTKILIN